MQTWLPLVAFAVVLAAACGPGAPPPLPGETLPGAAPFDAPTLARLRAAWVARPAGYTPRTRHLLPDGAPRYTNRLILEPSPYLRQHAHNPVDWYPWGDEAFDDARAGSAARCSSRVGYSTCHWCHVMEEESFEDEEIAALPERALRRHQGRPRGAPRRRRDLHERRAGADRRRRLADDGLAHARAPAVLRRHLLPAARRRPRRRRGLPDRAAHARNGVRTSSRSSVADGGRRSRRRAGPRRTSPARAAATPLAGRAALDARGGICRAQLRRRARRLSARAQVPAAPAGRASCSATSAAPATPRRSHMATQTLERWRRAASTTRSAAASIATRPTRAGWCRTSRRCSTTTRCSRRLPRGLPGDRPRRLRRRRARDPRVRRRAT